LTAVLFWRCLIPAGGDRHWFTSPVLSSPSIPSPTQAAKPHARHPSSCRETVVAGLKCLCLSGRVLGDEAYIAWFEISSGAPPSPHLFRPAGALER
jgi:hypothetical protein